MNQTRLIAGAAFALLFGLLGCEGAKEQAKATDAEVDRFHRLWNADEFKPIYDDAHMTLHNSQTDDGFVAKLEQMKRTYGQFKSTKIQSSTVISDYEVNDLILNYASEYDRGSAVEIFVYRMIGSRPMLLSYDIMPPESAKKRASEKEDAREAERKAMEEKVKTGAAGTPNG